MAKSKNKSKKLSGVNGKLLQKGGRKHSSQLPKIETDSEARAASKKSMENAVKMAKIEQYAKANKITIAQAMVHFM